MVIYSVFGLSQLKLLLRFHLWRNGMLVRGMVMCCLNCYRRKLSVNQFRSCLLTLTLIFKGQVYNILIEGSSYLPIYYTSQSKINQKPLNFCPSVFGILPSLILVTRLQPIFDKNTLNFVLDLFNADPLKIFLSYFQAMLRFII